MQDSGKTELLVEAAKEEMDLKDRRLNHTFVVCAYGESPYLEECIESLEDQSVGSHIIISTSTPNDYIKGIAEKHDLKVYVNEGESGITQDWNFGLSRVNTKYATLAHQDDVYDGDYLRYVYVSLKKAKNPIIAFSDYYELRNGEKSADSTMLKIKRLMSLPLRLKFVRRSIILRRRLLGFGNLICCPSVTYVMDRIEQPLFENHFRSNEDWEAWEKLSKQTGDFVYVPAKLMSHRVHEGSTTFEMIQDDKRSSEDYEMFRKFWPGCIAKLLCRVYKKSEKYNGV